MSFAKAILGNLRLCFQSLNSMEYCIDKQQLKVLQLKRGQNYIAQFWKNSPNESINNLHISPWVFSGQFLLLTRSGSTKKRLETESDTVYSGSKLTIALKNEKKIIN